MKVDSACRRRNKFLHVINLLRDSLDLSEKVNETKLFKSFMRLVPENPTGFELRSSGCQES
jgi:hypothetical protein